MCLILGIRGVLDLEGTRGFIHDRLSFIMLSLKWRKLDYETKMTSVDLR